MRICETEIRKKMREETDEERKGRRGEGEKIAKEEAMERKLKGS